MTSALHLDSWISIAAVERDTGVSKDTLRVWERRYGFPQPERDARGDRIYSSSQLEKLRLVKRLIDGGQRPGKLLGMHPAELEKLVRPGIGRQRKRRRATTFTDEKRHLLLADLACLQQHALDTLRERLEYAMARDGAARLAIERIEPLNQVVADAVTRGQLAACAEWAYMDCVQRVLIEALMRRDGVGIGAHAGEAPSAAVMPQTQTQALPPAGTGQTVANPPDRPKVLLASFAHEPAHAGLVAAEAVLTAEQCACIALGGPAPVTDIAQAAQAYACHVLVLGFGRASGAHEVSRGLRQLHDALPPNVAVWVLGPARATPRHLRPDWRDIPALAALAPAVVAWRKVHRVADALTQPNQQIKPLPN